MSRSIVLQDVLGQLILVRLPDPIALGRDPDAESSLISMELFLLLILGCAVQGPIKQVVIEDIKKLPLATQHAIVECIQQVIHARLYILILCVHVNKYSVYVHCVRYIFITFFK